MDIWDMLARRCSIDSDLDEGIKSMDVECLCGDVRLVRQPELDDGSLDR